MSDKRDIETWANRLRNTLMRLAMDAGNGKAAAWRFQQIAGVSPAAQQALLYRRRAGSCVLARVRRAWLRVLIDGLQRDIAELEQALREAGDADAARLVDTAAALVGALEDRLRELQKEDA